MEENTDRGYSLGGVNKSQSNRLIGRMMTGKVGDCLGVQIRVSRETSLLSSRANLKNLDKVEAQQFEPTSTQDVLSL